MQKIIVANNPKDITFEVGEIEIVSAKKYLTDPIYSKLKNVRVFNLCKQYNYQTKGYYVSLLAEARSHKVIPNLKTILDLKASTLVKIISDETEDLIKSSLRKLKSEKFVLSIYFGKNPAKQYDRLSKQLYMLFQAPFIRAYFKKIDNEWVIQNIRLISFKDIPEQHWEYVKDFASEYFGKKRYVSAKENKYLFDLAILVNQHEKDPPSNKKALARFAEAAEAEGFSVDFITKDDYNKVDRYDALFIRETTNVNHHTYKFARRADAEGIVVIDDPLSILRCTNKVYLAELLNQNKIPAPLTEIVHSDNIKEAAEKLGFPCVLKLPDSYFSQGVIKTISPEEFKVNVKEMLKTSDLIIAQQFRPTDYDWRIGVLDGKPIFSCKYYMAKNHWQIYNWESKKNSDVSGSFDTLAIKDTPPGILDIAVKTSNLIGKGLYGVDIKEIDGKPLVIEVNDNPNIDAEIEDKVTGIDLYLTVIRSIKRRIENKMNSPQ